MNQKLAEKCYQALKSSEFWTSKTKENDRTISNLICPACGDKSAWAFNIDKSNGNAPGAIICNRKNECGVSTKTIELFNLTLDIEKEYKPSKTEPNKPATEFLKSRGLTKISLDELDHRYWKTTRKGVKCGAVMFPIGKDSKGKEILNGRLLNPAQDDGKTHNHGSTTGLYWQHNAQPLDVGKPVFITEGIIDALSLIEMGQQAIAVLSSGQDPSKLSGLDQYLLILAFDNDKAGVNATRKYLDHFPKASAIMPPRNIDWNDIIVRNKAKSEKYFKDNKSKFEQNAELSLADNAHVYGKLYYDFFGYPPGLFTFDGCTWFASLRVKGENSNLAVERVGLFTIEALSFINVGDEKNKEYLYQLCVTPLKQQPVVCVASAKAFTGTRDFNAFLLSSAKVNFEGKVNALTELVTQITRAKIKEVRQVAVCGYDPTTNWYFFDSYAIDKKGNIHYKNKSGNYKLDHKSMIAPAPQSSDKAITPTKTASVDVKEIYHLFHRAWEDNGAMAFSWTIASWFVNQIKEKENFFPFLSLFGDPAAGKSALTEKLQAIQGRNIEGLKISQLNTKKGLARTMAGFSGMFTALLEDSQRNERAFDYSILLTTYNRGSLQVQAKFSQTLETKENPFLGSLMFVQNNEPFNQKAEKQRVISLNFKVEDLNGDTKNAFNKLNNLPKNQLAKVMQEVLKRRSKIEATWYDEYKVAAADLTAISGERIRNNHAIMLAFHRIFCKLFNIDLEVMDIYKHVEEAGLAKEKSSAELEVSEASIFFEQVFSLDSEQLPKYWHEIKESESGRIFNTLYISIQEVLRLLNSHGLPTPRANDLLKALKIHPAYLRHGTNHRFLVSPTHSKRRKAWEFDLAKFRDLENPPHEINWER